MMKSLLVGTLCLFMLTGCSALAATSKSATSAQKYLSQVEKNANDIRAETDKDLLDANLIAVEATTIKEKAVEVPPDVPAITTAADKILTETAKETADPKVIGESADKILGLTKNAQSELANIQRQIPRMDDKTPLWLKVLYLGGIVGILVLVWLLLERTGFMLIIKKFLWGLGLLIPEPAKAEAKLMDKAERGEISMAELIQYFRTKYPDINAAIENREKKESAALSTLGLQLSSSQSSEDAPLSGQRSNGAGHVLEPVIEERAFGFAGLPESRASSKQR
jgi:hypothetical protein